MAQRDDSDFDAYAAGYDAALARGLVLSGEGKEYFARGRLRWLANCLQRIGFRPANVLDFGCGTGTSIPLIVDILGADSVVGLDASRRALEVAAKSLGEKPVRFVPADRYRPAGDMDLVFTNGVFHHIEPEDRPAALAVIERSLRPGGILAFWENNPLNPGTRWVMRRIPFDRDARPITGGGAARLLRPSGLEVLRTDYLFVFPRVLRACRRLEPWLCRLPIGAQYQILARKSRSPE